jgi:hypothetical protein
VNAAEAMFDFGDGAAVNAACAPLAWVAGPLLIDSGEEDTTFVFRCQDRYPVYSALAGLRSLLFVLDDHHAGVYDACLERVRHGVTVIGARTGVLCDAVIPAPLYVGYDPIAGSVRRIARTQAALGDPAHVSSLRAGIRTNQVSPTCARLLAGTAQACAEAHTTWDLTRCRRQAELALRFHDKASYVELLRGADPGVAPHVATALVDAESLFAIESWPALCAQAGVSAAATSRLHVKSSVDSGGNLAAVLSAENLAPALAALESEWRAGSLAEERARLGRIELNARKVRSSWTLGPAGIDRDIVAAAVDQQARVRAGQRVRFLVQPRVQARAGAPAASIGCSYAIGTGGAIAPMCAAEQAFVDADRRRHVGSILDDRVERDFFASPAAAGFTALCAAFAAEGYRGPISFDAVRDAEGRYVGVFDCNPRLTAIFPAMAVREALRAQGARCDTIVNLDYRGLYRWPDLEARLAALDDRDLLYTGDRQKGVLALPSLANRDGFDVHLVNMSRAEIDAVLRRDLLGEAVDFDKGAIRTLYR